MEEQKNAPTGESGRSSGPISGSGGTSPGGGNVGGNSGGTGSTGNGNRGGGNSGATPGIGVRTTQGGGGIAGTVARPPAGRDAAGTGGVRSPVSGSNPGRGSGEAGGAKPGAVGRTEAPTLKLVGGLDEEKDDASEEPQRPSYVGIPRSTKATKNQNAPPQPRKGKAGDVDPETVAIGVSVAFEVPAIVCQWITPLQGGHPWWSKSKEEVADVAEPLTEIINGMSPKVKKAIKENTAIVAVLVGMASLVQEPIAMEIALHKEIKLARQQLFTGGLPSSGVTVNGSAPKRNQRPSAGIQAAREFNPPLGIEEDEGDFAV